MMQSLIGQAIVAAALAIVVLLIAVLLGVGVGYREEIRPRKLDLYAKATVALLTVITASYLHITGIFSHIDLLIAGLWVSLLVLCTDWSKLGRRKSA